MSHPIGPSLLDSLPRDFATRRDVVSDGSRTLSGAELIAEVSRLANSILTLGGQRVALLADNGIPWIVADLACQLANVTLLPIPPFFTAGQIHHAVAEVGIDLFLLGREQQWGDILADDIRNDYAWRGERAGLRIYQNTPCQVRLPAGTGKITYTSGSTGNPKGVCLSNDQLIKQAKALADAVAIPGTQHLCLLPLSVLLENVAGVYTALMNGGSVIAPPLEQVGMSGSSSLNPAQLLTALHRHAPDTLILIPQLLTTLVQACEMGWQPPASLKFIAVGGSKVAPGLVARARDCGLPVYEGYGLSECASVVSLNTPQYDRIGSVGKPLSHLKVSCDNGEVTITGNPFLGYVADPTSWQPQHIASGDLGHLDEDGYLHLQGRKKNLLITSFGRNVSPEWVESELTAGPLLQDVVVVGDGKPWLTALLYPRNTEIGNSDIDAWVQTVNTNLPDYARIGRWMRLATPLNAYDGLTTATGKPRRDAIYRYFQTAIEQLYDDRCAEVLLPCNTQ